MWFRQLLHRQCLRRPDALALRDRHRDLTWRALNRDVTALAESFRGKVPAGGRVMILSGNRVEVVVAHIACAVSGRTAVPLNPAATDPEIEYILAAVTPELALADEAGRRRLSAIDPRLSLMDIESIGQLPEPSEAPVDQVPDEHPVLILHTSATSGNPKGVIADERYFRCNALSWLADTHIAEDSVFLQAGPLFHGSLILVHNFLAANGTVCVLDRFTPQGFFSALPRWGITHVFLVPSMVRLILDSRQAAEADPVQLRLIMTGGAPLPTELVDDVKRRLGVAVRNNYAITEAGGPVTALWPDDRPPESPEGGATCVGVPIPGVEVRIAHDGAVLPASEIGGIQVRTDSVMRGYWNNPAATAAALRDGWLDTGDIGFLDRLGYLWMLDRRNDLILRGGQNVYPAEIERVLGQSGRVAEVAVVARPSETWGQVPVAYVEATTAGFEGAELLRLCVRELSGYKVPVEIVRVDALPRNSAGKVLRRVLREWASGSAHELGAVTGGHPVPQVP